MFEFRDVEPRYLSMKRRIVNLRTEPAFFFLNFHIFIFQKDSVFVRGSLDAESHLKGPPSRGLAKSVQPIQNHPTPWHARLRYAVIAAEILARMMRTHVVAGVRVGQNPSEFSPRGGGEGGGLPCYYS